MLYISLQSSAHTNSAKELRKIPKNLNSSAHAPTMLFYTILILILLGKNDCDQIFLEPWGKQL